jgi:hypothetical protein
MVFFVWICVNLRHLRANMGGRVEFRNPKSELGGGAGTIHSAHKEAAMEEHSLTFGAHLLLWVFPLVLVVLVIVEDLLDRFKPESER